MQSFISVGNTSLVKCSSVTLLSLLVKQNFLYTFNPSGFLTCKGSATVTNYCFLNVTMALPVTAKSNQLCSRSFTPYITKPISINQPSRTIPPVQQHTAWISLSVIKVTTLRVFSKKCANSYYVTVPLQQDVTILNKTAQREIHKYSKYVHLNVIYNIYLPYSQTVQYPT